MRIQKIIKDMPTKSAGKLQTLKKSGKFLEPRIK
jgi:hypothetical protein